MVHAGVPLLEYKKYPLVPAAVACKAPVPLPYKIPLLVNVLAPVPPSATTRSVMPVIVPPVIVALDDSNAATSVPCA